MVKNSGAASRPHRLRTLNEPRPIQVETLDDRPVALIEKEVRHRITQIQDTWIIQDEWWRQELFRQYYELLLDNDTRRTVFHDRIADRWYEQAY
ncbi:MAG TPA: hypothetical protein VNZ58_06315 [Thermomicrobiales bacterium]|nr:hypothetical protein [Thermomicrobiales bacterium]